MSLRSVLLAVSVLMWSGPAHWPGVTPSWSCSLSKCPPLREAPGAASCFHLEEAILHLTQTCFTTATVERYIELLYRISKQKRYTLQYVPIKANRGEGSKTHDELRLRKCVRYIEVKRQPPTKHHTKHPNRFSYQTSDKTGTLTLLFLVKLTDTFNMCYK